MENLFHRKPTKLCVTRVTTVFCIKVNDISFKKSSVTRVTRDLLRDARDTRDATFFKEILFTFIQKTVVTRVTRHHYHTI